MLGQTEGGSNNYIPPSSIATGAYACHPVLDGTNVIEFTLDRARGYVLNDNIKYFVICCGGLSDDSIITINEPIDNESSAYTNWIPKSINADGTQYVGENGEDGYKVGYRINSSGNEDALDGTNCTGYIPVAVGDVIRFKNIAFTPGGSEPGAKIQMYKEDFSSLNGIQPNAVSAMAYLIRPYETDATTGYISSFTIVNADGGYKYIRVSSPTIGKDSIITINEPIE